jgi:dimethylamine/trimethylamine dehydrogenase
MTRDAIAGADASLPHVLTPEQVMLDGKRPPGRRVAVIDLEGYFTGAGMAEVLAGEGYQVTVLTCFHVVAHHCDQTLEGLPLRRRLHELGVRAERAIVPTAVAPGGVSLLDEHGAPYDVEADGAVLVTQRLSDDALYRELVADPDALADAGIEAVYRIGDCVAPRFAADAIFDGHRLAREIDAEDPARPLPYRRERPLVGVPVV